METALNNLEATVRAEITKSNQPSLKRGFWKVWARGATPGANEMMLNELIQNKQSSIDPAFRYDQDNVYLAYVNTIQSPGDIQLGLYFNDFQSNYSDWEPIEKATVKNDKGETVTIFNEYNVYLAGPSSIQYPDYKIGWSDVGVTTDKTPANIQSVSVCNNWLNVRPLNGETVIDESPVVSLEVPEKERDSQKPELNKRSQIYKTYLSTFVRPLKKDNAPIDDQTKLFDRYNYQNRDIFVQLIHGTSNEDKTNKTIEETANALASLLLLKANSPAYKSEDDNSENAAFEDISLNLTLKSNSPIFKNTILRSENGEYNAKETFGDPKIGFHWYYPTRSTTHPDYIIQFGVPELCCEFLYRKSSDRYPKPFTLDSSTDGVKDSNSIKIDILAQIFRILLYAGANYKQSTDPIDIAYAAYRDGVNSRWGKQGWVIDAYWKTAADEEKKYIKQYYNSKNKDRIIQDLKTLFGDSKVNVTYLTDKPDSAGNKILTKKQIQIPRGLYISLGQNPWAPYYSENPKVEGLLSEDYKNTQDFKESERLDDITLELTLDDYVTITELGGSSTEVTITDDPSKKIQKSLKFTFKPYAREFNKDANSIVIAKASVKTGESVIDDYSKFHYDNFVRASRDLSNKKNNNFFIYNLNKKTKDTYNYVRCIHKEPSEYKREDYKSIAIEWLKNKHKLNSSENIEIAIDKIFARSKFDYISDYDSNVALIGDPISIALSKSDFVIDHNYTVSIDEASNKKTKVKNTTYRNVSLYLVSVLNYHLWKDGSLYDDDSFNIYAYKVIYEVQENGKTVKELRAVNTPYSILAVPVADNKAYDCLNNWLYEALSVKDITNTQKEIDKTQDKHIDIKKSESKCTYPQRASSTLLKNLKTGKNKSLANEKINTSIIFDPYQIFSKDSITPGNKYGTAPINYYYVAVAIDYTKSEITEGEGDSQTTKLESEFEPFEIKFVKQTGQKTFIDLYKLPVDFSGKNPETPKDPDKPNKEDSEKLEEPGKSKETEEPYPSYIN